MIEKNGMVIATETKPLPTPEQKPRLKHMVACKTVREYNNRNQEKIRKFCLEEEKAAKRPTITANTQGPSSPQTISPSPLAPRTKKQAITKNTTSRSKIKTETKWSKD